MIDHMTLRVRDYAKSKAFYAAALAPLGYEMLMEWEGFSGFAVNKKPGFGLAAAGDRKYTQRLIAVRARDRRAGHAFYDGAMKPGATGTGAARPPYAHHPHD